VDISVTDVGRKVCACSSPIKSVADDTEGHWIQECPNGDDPAVAERKRFVRVTGIPRSMLQTVETPVGNEGSSGGAMLTADGGFVRAVPDQYVNIIHPQSPLTQPLGGYFRSKLPNLVSFPTQKSENINLSIHPSLARFVGNYYGKRSERLVVILHFVKNVSRRISWNDPLNARCVRVRLRV
jgi:hypothetical protein